MRIYVYLCICVHVCMCVCVNVYVYAYVYMYICVYVHMRIRVYVCMCVCACVGMYICVCVHVYVYIYICVCVYVDMYRCIYVYVDIFIYAYMYVYVVGGVIMFDRVSVCICLSVMGSVGKYGFGKETSLKPIRSSESGEQLADLKDFKALPGLQDTFTLDGCQALPDPLVNDAEAVHVNTTCGQKIRPVAGLIIFHNV